MPPTRRSRGAAQTTASVFVLLTGALKFVWIFGCASAARSEGTAAANVAQAGAMAWTSGEALSFPPIEEPDSQHIAYKDPSVVQVGNSWNVYASRVRHQEGKTRYSLVYFGFPDWERTGESRVVPLLTQEQLACAPHVFYFSPQQRWYLFYVWKDARTSYNGPAFSTLDDVDRPDTLSAPRACFPKVPDSLPKKNKWLDFTVIADASHAYLFFTDDAGNFLRCRTALEEFPLGWSDPVVALSAPTSVVFEGNCTYKVKDRPEYLTLIEAIGPQGRRFYNSFVASALDGDWRCTGTSYEHPFAGPTNVRFSAGSEPWSIHISHGELIRASYDETMLWDPGQARFLFQGWNGRKRVPGVVQGKFDGYHEIPWQLGLLHAAAVRAQDANPRHAAVGPTPVAISIEVDAAHPTGPFRPIWRFFGADEPNYAYLKDGKKLLGELGELGPTGKTQVYFRAHHLLTSGDGAYALKFGSTSAYKEDANGNPIYDWTINDRIFDTYLACGIKPYAQLGFMPEALSTHPQDYPRNPPLNVRVNAGAGQAYPPKDYTKWGELCHQWVKHCVERYGRAEVEQWYWEVWNEPNIRYWKGTPEEFRQLHDYAIDGVRRALPTARVGGPHTAGPGGDFMREFLAHCLRGTNFATGQRGTPLDFIAFHAKGTPTFVDGHVRMGIASQLRALDQGFALVNEFPELKGKPIIIGESDPDGCAACQGPQLGYRNTTMYSSYTAAAFARHLDLAERHRVNLEGAITWAFEFENQPWFAGFRVLASNGISLPVFNVFRMFSQMGGQRLPVASTGAVALDTLIKEGVRGTPDVSALASLEGNKLCVMVWHYHDDDVAGPDAEVRLNLTGLPAATTLVHLRHYRIDRDHSNAFTAWQRLGSPAAPTPDQYVVLERSAQLAEFESKKEVAVTAARLPLTFALPRQAVSLLILEWE